MGKIKPIGSEKLTGIDAINRILEISNYKLNKPVSINETSSHEYKKTLANNETYHIVREKSGYVIKKGLNESTSEYIDPMKHRKYYSSYSQALKRLNIITKEINVNEGYDYNISLFESDDDGERYVLRVANEQATAPQPAPQQKQAPVPPQKQQSAPPAQGQQQMPPMPEEPMDDMGMGEFDDMPEEPIDDMGDEGMEDMPEEPQDGGDEEELTYKVIQKYTGKLAQKIRQFLSDEDNQLTSEDTLYVINSILSALPIDTLEDDDKEKIMAKFEGGDQEYEMEVDDDGTGDFEDGGDMEAGMKPEMEQPEPGMEQPEEMKEYDNLGRHNRNMRERQSMKRNLYSESTIDNVLSGYFTEDRETIAREKTFSKVKKISESYEQERSVKKLLNQNPFIKLLGKNSSGNLVFENRNYKISINRHGDIL